jgi:TonB-linked SusC/RagA family outer membrane protein
MRLLALVLILILSTGISFAQTGTIQGTVTDAAAERGLPGVNVTIVELAGEGFGAATTADGTYQIQGVPAGTYTVRARFVSYKTGSRTVTVSEGETVEVNFELSEDILGLDEVVITGQATSVERRNLANDVSTVSSQDIERVPAQSVDQALQGKIAGANIQSNSGAPGGGLQVRLRGVSTIIGNHTPLYVVDGVIVSNASLPSGLFQVTASSEDPQRGGSQDGTPNRIADLNPQDIESIEILKGASASAIYGSKASNGVVIIQTKQGSGGETEYNISQRLGVAQLSNTVGSRRFVSEEDAVAAFGDRAADFWEPGRYFDHEEQIAGRNPFLYETSLSASGSFGGTRFYVSGLQKDEGGIIESTGYEKQSVRLNLQQPIGDRLSLDINTNAVRSQSARGFTNNDNRSISYWMTFPSTPSFVDLRADEDGGFPDNPFSDSNPLQTAALSTNQETVWRFIGSSQASFQALTGDTQTLEIIGTAGADYFTAKYNILTPPELQFEPTDGLPGTSVLSTAYSNNLNFSLNAVHRYRPSSLDLEATTSVGTQFEVRDLDYSRTTARALIAGQSNIDKGTSVGVYQLRERVEDQGFFLQEELLFKDRLFVTASIRADRSSNNSDTDALYWYPKAAASYRFPSVLPGTVDEVKLRVAYGESGNRPKYGQKFTEYVGQNIDGLAAVTLQGITASDELKPERQREIEGGIDLTLFGERANLSLTGYLQRTTDVLLERELPQSSGFSTAVFNGGEIAGRGFEAQLRAVPIQTDRFRWSSTTNFSTTRAEMESLPVPPFQTQGFGFLFGSFFITEGGSLTAIHGNKPTDDGGSEVGQIGDSTPEFKIGFSNDFRLGPFSAFVLADFQKGGDVLNLTQLLFDLSSNSPDCNNILPSGQSECARRVSEWPTNTAVYLYDTTYLKLREVTLSYQVPQRFVETLRLRNARLSISGRNLLTFTDYPGMDPEVSNFGSQAIGRNIDVAPYPPSRQFWFSVNLGF